MTLALRTRSFQNGGNVFYRDNNYSVARGGVWDTAPMLAALTDPGAFFLMRDDFRVFDNTATVGDYAVVKDGSVAQTMLDRAGGWLNLVTDVNDNDEVYLSSMAENWLFATTKPLWFEARIELTEANTDDANIIVGVSDTVAANSLLDNGAGPMASYDGAVFFKVDGGTVWQFETSNAGTQATTTSVATFTSGTAYRLGFTFDPNDGTTGLVTPYINGVAYTAKNITLSGLEEMHILLGVKAGGTNAETLKVDYVQVLQVRT
jgi:hypothetical protein